MTRIDTRVREHVRAHARTHPRPRVATDAEGRVRTAILLYNSHARSLLL